jgi:hypothetical protein
MSDLESTDLSIGDPLATAERMRLERAAVLSLSNEALKAGVVADAIAVCRELAALGDDPRSAPAARLGVLLAAAKGVMRRVGL